MHLGIVQPLNLKRVMCFQIWMGAQQDSMFFQCSWLVWMGGDIHRIFGEKNLDNTHIETL